MRFYLAGRYQRRAELAEKAAGLSLLTGWESVGRWLTQHDGSIPRQQCAQEDVEDLLKANIFILMTEIPYDPDTISTGGRHFEHGLVYMANLLRVGEGMEPARIIRIGHPDEKVFDQLPGQEYFTDWASFIAAVKVAELVK